MSDAEFAGAQAWLARVREGRLSQHRGSSPFDGCGRDVRLPGRRVRGAGGQRVRRATRLTGTFAVVSVLAMALLGVALVVAICSPARSSRP